MKFEIEIVEAVKDNKHGYFGVITLKRKWWFDKAYPLCQDEYGKLIPKAMLDTFSFNATLFPSHEGIIDLCLEWIEENFKKPYVPENKVIGVIETHIYEIED